MHCLVLRWLHILSPEADMIPTRLPPDDDHLFDLCAKHFGRAAGAARHNYFGMLPPGEISEAWRFPVVETHGTDDEGQAGRWNEVTFVFFGPPEEAGPIDIRMRGTFAPLYEQFPLDRVGSSRYFAAAFRLPVGQTFLYRFRAGGAEFLDPVNPQVATGDDGRQWSRFFTEACFEAVTFERWERVILDRLTRHILPFNTFEAREFLSRLSDSHRASHPYLHRFDLSVGVVNFLDKLLAREERHQLSAYKTCLSICNDILRARNPYLEPRDMPETMFVELYAQMQSGVVPGWDYGRYGNPAYFLQMLRRHTISGAFSHPRYGGNAGGAAWDYLSDKYRGEDRRTLFDWQRAIEAPLGTSTEYRG
jgi:hypothetical protein